MNHKITIQIKIEDFRPLVDEDDAYDPNAEPIYEEEDFINEIFEYFKNKIEHLDTDFFDWVADAPDNYENIRDYAKKIEFNIKLETNKKE